MDDQDEIAHVAERSQELHAALQDVLEGADGYSTFDGSLRADASAAAGELSLEHASALRILMTTGHPSSATALLRLQYEAVVRSAWLLFAATDAEVSLIQSELDEEAERKASSLPMVGVMLKALEANGPDGLHNDLTQVKAVLGKGMNSFIHAGIHALDRTQSGFPVRLAKQVIASSNGISTMAAMLLANLTGEVERGRAINRLVPSFADVLPSLHRRNGVGA
ncbi:DUF6988 family protein [Roseateles noduli]|uniref:DUF6988 family protein n=1 Tax=Roseateles noduli TaxID=2052484 RepID=UPI003D64BFBC